jgi:hypothetical protein
MTETERLEAVPAKEELHIALQQNLCPMRRLNALLNRAAATHW